MRHQPLIALLCLVAAAAGAGCGRTDQERVREVAQDYIQAASGGDFAAACHRFTDRFLHELGGEGGCEAALAGQYAQRGAKPEVELASVQVKGHRASAELRIKRDGGAPSPFTLLLIKGGAGWQISGQQ